MRSGFSVASLALIVAACSISGCDKSGTGDDQNSAEGEHSGSGMAQAPDPAECTEAVDPVCGADGVSYDNDCLAGLAGAQVDYLGACQCICPMIEQPVCANGQTYSNPCQANCDGHSEFSMGDCEGGLPSGRAVPSGLGVTPGSCICPRDFRPVCGSDGQTYPNTCAAQCVNVAVESPGPCAGDESDSLPVPP